MAPSDVDMEAAQMPISTQHPRNVGSCVHIDIDIGRHTVQCKVRRAQAGRIPVQRQQQRTSTANKAHDHHQIKRLEEKIATDMPDAQVTSVDLYSQRSP